jgi:hypothetical protein
VAHWPTGDPFLMIIAMLFLFYLKRDSYRQISPRLFSRKRSGIFSFNALRAIYLRCFFLPLRFIWINL